MTHPEPSQELPEFSLVQGPLYRLCLRTGVADPQLGRAGRRVALIALIAWLPLLLLSALEGHALGGSITVPFLYDFEAHLRYLLALPVLIIADRISHNRLQSVVHQLVDRGIVIPEDRPAFRAAIDSVMRVVNSVIVQSGLAVFVYTVGQWLWRTQVALDSATWSAHPEGAGLTLTLAGSWYVFVSIPLFQFIFFQWYLRFFVWIWFVWRVSRLNLHLVPTHADRTGGMGFLDNTAYAFEAILFAHGVLLAGMIANRIFFEGQSLLAFKLDIVAFVSFFVLVILSPLVLFTPHLTRAWRQGRREYGSLVNRYVREFEAKWIRGGAPKDEGLLGSSDIQSLADLGNSYAVVREMRRVPFGKEVVLRLAVVTAAPLLPLTLTMVPLEKVVDYLIKVLLF